MSAAVHRSAPNRCAACRAAVMYQGGRHARDLDGELHACDLPALPRSLLCVCGAVVSVLADGSRLTDDGAPHVHAATRAPREVAIEKAPHPAEQPTAEPQRRGAPMPAKEQRPTFTGGFSGEIIVVNDEG